MRSSSCLWPSGLPDTACVAASFRVFGGWTPCGPPGKCRFSDAQPDKRPLLQPAQFQKSLESSSDWWGKRREGQEMLGGHFYPFYSSSSSSLWGKGVMAVCVCECVRMCMCCCFSKFLLDAGEGHSLAPRTICSAFLFSPSK